MTNADDPYQPGFELDRRFLVLDEEIADRYLETTGAPRRGHGTTSAPRVVPAVALAPQLFALGERSVPPLWGTTVLTASMSWQHHAPMHVGEEVTMVICVVDRYIRNGRDHLCTEMTVQTADGTLACVGTVTVMTPVPTPSPEPVQ
ncbi:MAG: MaoC family dehydratase N-terminal domain-containing protein [Mycobacterium sp.]